MSRHLLRVFAFGFGCVLLFLASGRSGAESIAQTSATITGSVVDGSLMPLAGIVVELERGARTVATATTDADGKFTFSNIAPGDYRVRIAHSGFPSYSRDLRVPERASRLDLPIVLMTPDERESSASTPKPAGETVNAPTQPPTTTDRLAAPPPTTPNVSGVAGGAAGDVSSHPRPEAARAPHVPAPPTGPNAFPLQSGERYAHVAPNRFQSTRLQPLSTFGADVDTASYANVRRFLSVGQLPPPDAVRVEELINYFRFDYAQPLGGGPVALTTEIGDCPWAPSHKLVLIGARARTAIPREIGGRNLVLLVDVSGSMAPAERLPLLKTALAQFVETLRPDDRLAIVTYAGWSGVVLPSTPLREMGTIQRAIAGLRAGGSTNGGQGLILAYRAAREAFIPGGVNRVILATDGDFNVGLVRSRDLLRLIERERESGVFLSVLGVGSGNLKDATMEMLADRGNGHYAYLDSLQEARRVLIREGDATLEVVAKDVKFQVEFNPAAVGAWKLIGYENRALDAEDFNDDRKDAGELGAGHTVTVLYEIIPAGSAGDRELDALARPAVDPFRYQEGGTGGRDPQPASSPAADTHPGEWLTVKVRYRAPDDERSELLAHVVRAGGPVRHLPLAAAVAEFGLLLRDGVESEGRWEALSRRIDTFDVPRALAADTEAFAELVAIAGGLSRTWRRQ